MHCVRKKTLNLLRFWQRHSDRCIRIILLCVPMLIRTYVSKEDVCGDDHVRVVSMISISVYYPFLLSVRVDGSGVNPPPIVDMFQRFGQDTFMPKSVETSSGFPFLAGEFNYNRLELSPGTCG